MALAIVAATPQAVAFGSSIAVTFTTPPAVGQGVVVVVAQRNSALTHVSCTDTHGHSYTLAKSQGAPSGSTGIDVFVCPVLTVTGAPFTITVAGASGTDRLAVALAVDGVGGGLVVDQSAGSEAISAGTVSTPATPALTAADVVLVAGLSVAAPVGTFLTVSAATPSWTQYAESLPPTPTTAEVDARLLPSATGATPSATWTNDFGAAYAAVAIVAFTTSVVIGVGGATIPSTAIVRPGVVAVVELPPVGAYGLEVELAGVGGGWTDLLDDVLRKHRVVARYGIDESGPQHRVAGTGTLSFALNNAEDNSATTLGYYSPHHASVRPGWGLGIRCRLRINDPDGIPRTRFMGRIDAIDPLPGVKGQRAVLVTAVDWLDEAARWKLTPEIGEQINQSWDAVLTAILAQMPVQPTATELHGGSESWPYALDTSETATQTALAEFAKLARSEYGLIYQRGDGTLVAEDRHIRMTATAVDWTLTDPEYQGLELPSTRDDVINTVRVTTHPRYVDPLPTVVVYDQTNNIEFAAGETKMLMGSYRDPITGDPIGATAIQPQVAGTDYVANTLPDGTGMPVSSSFTVSVTAGQSGVRFDVTNGTGAGAVLTTLQLRGKGIYDHGATVHEATDAASIAVYGEHAIDYDMPYQVRQDVGQAAADYILATCKDSLAQVRAITVFGKNAALLTQILTRDISDRIAVSETVTGVSDEFFINGVELTIIPSGHLVARYTLAPAEDLSGGHYFILDVSSLDGPDILAPF